MNSSANNVIFNEIEEARRFFSQLKAGEHNGFGTAKAMSNWIENTLKDNNTGFSVLAPDGKSSNAKMELELNKATVNLQVSDSIGLFNKLKAGDIHISPVYMAGRIREDLADVGQKLDALDPKGKKTAQQMDDELTKHTVIQQLKIVRQNFADLSNSVITISPEHMEKTIRKDLEDIGKDLSALNTNPKVTLSAQEMDNKLKAIVSGQSAKLEKLNEAKAIYEYLEGKGLSANSRVKIDKVLTDIGSSGNKRNESEVSAKDWGDLIRKKMEESGRPLSALIDGETINSVENKLNKIVMQELAKSKPKSKEFDSPGEAIVPNAPLSKAPPGINSGIAR